MKPVEAKPAVNKEDPNALIGLLQREAPKGLQRMVSDLAGGIRRLWSEREEVEGRLPTPPSMNRYDPGSILQRLRWLVVTKWGLEDLVPQFDHLGRRLGVSPARVAATFLASQSTCQVCGRVLRLGRDGKIPRHDLRIDPVWERWGGKKYRGCPGVGHPPLEQSTDRLMEFWEELGRPLILAEQRLAEVDRDLARPNSVWRNDTTGLGKLRDDVAFLQEYRNVLHGLWRSHQRRLSAKRVALKYLETQAGER